MQTIKLTAGPYVTASANNIALSQVGAANALTLNGSLATGGVATLDEPRRVLFTDSGDNRAVSYVVMGTTWGNSPATETVAGTNGSTVYTNTDFLTVTGIAITGAATAPQALTVGTNTVASSAWARMDSWANPSINIQTVVVGTVSYTLQCTMDDPNLTTAAITGPLGASTPTIAGMTWDSILPGVVGATASTSLVMTFVPTFIRILMNSWTTTGNVTASVMQTGAVPY